MPTTSQTGRTHYRGPAEAGAPRLAGLPGVRRVEVLATRVVEVQRYDTDDHRLAAAGIVLALHREDGEGDRGEGDGAGEWSVDLPDGDAREELRTPLEPGAPEPAPVPDRLDELLRGVTRDRAVRPVGRARTTRTVHRLHGDDGVLAEVAHEQVTVATMGRTTDVSSWTEAHVELVTADAELRDALAARLADHGLQAAEPAAAAQLDRMLRPRSARRRGTGRRSSAGDVLLAYLAAQVDRLGAEDLRVRRDEPDAVHQLRVAARRLRSALQAYRPLLDSARTEPLVDELRTLGQVLAPARDAEVLRERITAGLADLAPELRLGGAQALVTRHFARTEAEARAALLTELDGARYAALRGALDDLLADPPLTARATRPARKEMPALVARAGRRLERAMATATDGALPAAERDTAVHTARKAGKRLRYATEVARPAVGRDAKRFEKQLKAFQKALGEHQDAVVARDALRELGAAAHAAGENGFSFGVLLGRDDARAARIEQDLPDLWAAAWRRRGRRRFT